MKILKKPKILPVTCERCGTVYKPKFREMYSDLCHIYAKCPICAKTNRVKFKEETHDNGTV